VMIDELGARRVGWCEFSPRLFNPLCPRICRNV
jgi:hypothetical protein